MLTTAVEALAAGSLAAALAAGVAAAALATAEAMEDAAGVLHAESATAAPATSTVTRLMA